MKEHVRKKKGHEDSTVRRWKGEGTREKPKGREESTVRRWEGEPTREKQKGRKSRGSNHGFLGFSVWKDWV